MDVEPAVQYHREGVAVGRADGEAVDLVADIRERVDLERGPLVAVTLAVPGLEAPRAGRDIPGHVRQVDGGIEAAEH